MRIVVNDIAAQKGGALTVLKDFYNYVKENDTENEWIFLLGEKLLEETDNIKIITLPKIKTGDILAIMTTGAYGYSMSSNYNRIPKPAVVMVRDGKPRLACRRETYEDVIKNDVL